MLSPGDSVAVIAVDSAPHVIQKLTPVEDPETIARKVKGIESMGGGIFVYEALVAAGKQLMDSDQSTKHIILFSDANDSEEPGDYKKLLAQFEKAGITTSVIGLGKPTDVDARLLEDIAKLGRGNIMFTEDAEELPRLFTQDTMSVARSSFIKKDADHAAGGNSRTGDSPAPSSWENSPPADFPTSTATISVISSPMRRWRSCRKTNMPPPGRPSGIAGWGGPPRSRPKWTGNIRAPSDRWEEYADFLITHARWLLGGDTPDDVYLKMERDGQDAIVTVELDPDRPAKVTGDAPTLSILPPVRRTRAGARHSIPMDRPQLARGAV